MRKIAFLMATASTGKLTGELARREKILRDIAAKDTQIDIYGLEKDPKKSHLGTIQSSYEAQLSTVEDLECAIAAEKAGYQAVIIPCGGDPGIAPLREILNVPVIPPGSTAKHLCSLLAPRFSVITTGKGKPKTILLHERDGLQKHVSTHPVGLTVPELRTNPEKAYEAMVREGHSAVNEHGAGAVTYGCMSMGFLMVDDRLTQEIGVPAINPVKAAVKTAETLIDLGITHSKRIYPVPPSLQK
ncbi:MAG: aspartate/glutamate racemase family protein [Candidatus Bathyarchaeota archaeon]|nr:aspartate/glutamate racemase family protein [Candidatus Bathyarchaeota archaeon]